VVVLEYAAAAAAAVVKGEFFYGYLGISLWSWGSLDFGAL